jgi:hypothetical protein
MDYGLFSEDGYDDGMSFHRQACAVAALHTLGNSQRKALAPAPIRSAAESTGGMQPTMTKGTNE